MDLSVDRKATDPEEVARIASVGGFVTNGRVLGTLAVARAIGDITLKEAGNTPAVISSPDIAAFKPEENDDFIILASDGLWDVSA